MKRTGYALTGLLLLACCSDDENKTASRDGTSQTEDATRSDAGTDAHEDSHEAGDTDASPGQHPPTPDDSEPPGDERSLTYWQDMLPIFEKHCLQCHREGGGAPFRLDEYAQAKAMAKAIQHSTAARHMPPWAVTSDGSCGDFADSIALTDAQIERIGAWVEGGAREGVPAQVELPAIETLTPAEEVATPTFTPQIQGGALAATDEYRCFAVDVPMRQRSFITGYDVVPSQPAIVHHVLAMLVDPERPTDLPDRPGLKNGALMRELDAESPDREGWPCFNAAGEGVHVDAFPISWGPGQGVVSYPNASGIPVKPTQRLVIQVHYNLADAAQRGKSERTIVRLQTAPRVENVGVFLLPDPMIDSLKTRVPHTLPAGKKSVPYIWRKSAADLAVGLVPEAQLYGVMPHMHQLGRKFQLRVSDAGVVQCAADVQSWDFHWQRMYFYEKPFAIGANSELEVTCDYDTSSVKEPVLPGWGTQNEMCLATLYFTVPSKVYEAIEAGAPLSAVR